MFMNQPSPTQATSRSPPLFGLINQSIKNGFVHNRSLDIQFQLMIVKNPEEKVQRIFCFIEATLGLHELTNFMCLIVQLVINQPTSFLDIFNSRTPRKCPSKKNRYRDLFEGGY